MRLNIQASVEPIVLLFLGALLFGGKTGLEFSAWSFACLFFCLKRIQGTDFTPFKNDFIGTGLFILGAIICQWLSLDSSISLFSTTQLLVYSFLWLALRIEFKRLPCMRFFDATLLILGIFTAGLTLSQEMLREVPVGFLPMNPNFNAIWMAVLAVLLIARSGDELHTPWQKWMELILAGGLSGLVIYGHSRSALAAWAVGGCFLLLHQFGWRFVVKTLSGAVLLALLLPGGWLWSRFRVANENGLRGDRLHFWKIAVQAIEDHPLAGYGAGNFELAYQRHAFPVMEDPVRFGRTTEFAHNEYLQILSELGLPTGGLLLLAAGYLLSSPVKKERSIALAAKAALVTLMFSALFNPVFHMPLLVYIALLLGALLISDPEGQSDSPQMMHSYHWIDWGVRMGIVFTMVLTAWAGMRSYWASRQEWERIVAFYPGDADAWHHIAYQQADPAQAALDFENATRLSPLQPYYQESLGLALEATQKSENMTPAMKAYEKALRQAPMRATDMLGIGRLLFRQNNPTAALVWFERARQTEPFYWEADFWIARCTFASGQKQRALFILQNLPERRQEFMKLFGKTASPISSYDRIILEFDEGALQKQLHAFQRS